MMVNGGKSKKEGNHAKKMQRKNQQVTSSNMVLKSLLRPARYFDGLVTNPCYTTTKPPRKPCLICASFNHVTKRCSMKHVDKDCFDKTSSSVCLRCGGLGHDMGLCKYEYTEDDLKSVQCYVCKSFGHLCCVEPCDSPPSLWAVSCYRCGQLGHTGLSCGRHYEGSSDIQSGFGRVKKAEKKKRRIVKALATSAAIRSDLEKKKQRLDEEGVAIFINDSTPHESSEKRERETATLSSLKNNKNLEQHSTLHESNWKTKKNNVESEQNFNAHESNRKRKKNKKAKGQQSPVAEKPNLRSGWITEDLEEDPFHRVKVRRLSSPTTALGHDHHILPVSPPGHDHRLPTAPSGHDHRILPVSPQGHNNRLPTTHFGHNYGSPRFISGGHYPGSYSTTPYDRNRINSSFESNGHLSGPPPSRLWQRNYLPTSPIAPLRHSLQRLPVTHNRSPTSSYGGHYTAYGGNHRYSSFESNRHLLGLPFSRLRQSYYSPTSPIAPSDHNHRLLPVTPPGLNHRLPAFSSGEHHTGSLSTIPPHGGNHRDSSFEYNGYHLDSPFSRCQPSYHPTSPITPPGHNHHMLPSAHLDHHYMLSNTYKGRNHRSPTFNSGGHYLSPLSSTRYGGNNRNSPFESDEHLSGPSTSRWLPYYTPTSSHHHLHQQQQQHIYGHPPSRYGPTHHYGEFSGSYEWW